MLSSVSLDNYPVGDGTVSIKIIDLERKVNINTANAMTIQQALTLMGVDANDISVVSDSILDWIDSDDPPRPAGAESDYYQGLSVPYYAKNAPIDDLSELLLCQRRHAGNVLGQQLDESHAPSSNIISVWAWRPVRLPIIRSGLRNFFTPFSNGKINVNTADMNVLQMIPGVDAAMADAIVKQRAGPDGVDGTEDDTPFQNVNQLAAITGLNPQQFGNLCDVHSFTFEVHVTVPRGNAPPREYVAILARTSGTAIQVLSFYWN